MRGPWCKILEKGFGPVAETHLVLSSRSGQTAVKYRAYAKINLALSILGKGQTATTKSAH